MLLNFVCAITLAVVFFFACVSYGGSGEGLESVLISLDRVRAALCSLCRWSYPQTFEFVTLAVVSLLDIPAFAYCSQNKHLAAHPISSDTFICIYVWMCPWLPLDPGTKMPMN